VRLADDVWRGRRQAHEARAAALVAAHLERSARGERHAVEDFLFTYYSHRPAQLRRWSPGAGVVLEGAVPDDLGRHGAGVDGGATLAPPPERVVREAAWTAALLRRTDERRPRYDCFGLHEWAMVHRTPQREVRHAALPLRLGEQATTAVVDRLPLRCTHFDAYRFFAPSAVPRNAAALTRDAVLDVEQPGCLHAGMDLYKWAYRLSPWVPGELVLDAFAHARRAREVDMRASPYDVSRYGLAAIEVETETGRAEYAAAQRVLAQDAAPLRGRLLHAAERIAQDTADTGVVPPR
jgi:hypothetical protein